VSAWKQPAVKELSSQRSETCRDGMQDLQSLERSEPHAILLDKCYIHLLSLSWPPPPKRWARPLFSTSASDFLADTKLLQIQKKRQKQKSGQLLGSLCISTEMVGDARVRKDLNRLHSHFSPWKQFNFQNRRFSVLFAGWGFQIFYWGQTILIKTNFPTNVTMKPCPN